MSERIVIIGAGQAASEAIFTLRKKGWQGAISLIGKEEYLPYHRPPLSKKYFTNEFESKKLLIRQPEHYAKADVDLHLGNSVTRIDRNLQQVVLDDGQSLAYSKLILATGTRVRPLAVKGARADNVHYLRTQDDVDGLKSSLTPGSTLLIVGAGYIGLEVAASAVKLGIKVIVLEAQDRVLARVTSPIVSEFYLNLHREKGVEIHLNVCLKEFQHNDNSSSAVLDDGKLISFDSCLIGIGVLPNDELARDADLECDNGIVINEFMQTSDENIYAIGDCSNFPSELYNKLLRLESVANAVDQAKTAALTICKQKKPYNEVPWFWSDQYDIKLQTAGLFQDHDEIIVRGELKSKEFAVFYFKKNVLIAVDAINSAAEYMASKKLIAKKAQLDKENLLDVNYSMKDFVKLHN